MKEYIEKIIEIILDNVSCEHQEIEEYPRGPKQDDPTYSLENEQAVIEQCIKAIPARLIQGPGIDEKYMKKKAEAMQFYMGLKEGMSLAICEEFVSEIISDAQRPEITVEFLRTKAREFHDKLWPGQICGDDCNRQMILRELLSSLLNELAAKISLIGKETL